MGIAEIQQEIIDEFSDLTDWFAKYEHLISQSNELPSMSAEDKNDKHLLSGCQSRVWIKSNCANGIIKYYADSDTQITRGLLSLLLRVVNGQPVSEVLNYEPYFIKEIGLDTHLSPSRANGLQTIIKRIKELAQNC